MCGEQLTILAITLGFGGMIAIGFGGTIAIWMWASNRWERY